MHVLVRGANRQALMPCYAEENQEHLVLCPGMQRDFWVSVAILMSHLNMDAGNTSKKWLLGIKADGNQVSRD